MLIKNISLGGLVTINVLNTKIKETESKTPGTISLVTTNVLNTKI